MTNGATAGIWETDVADFEQYMNPLYMFRIKNEQGNLTYNHYATSDGERTEWGYDSDPNVAPQHNIWNWYQGLPSDYPGNISVGYLDNLSTGFAPRWSEENVRQMMTSSAAALFDDFHIDGIRVDLTDAIH